VLGVPPEQYAKTTEDEEPFQALFVVFQQHREPRKRPSNDFCSDVVKTRSHVGMFGPRIESSCSLLGKMPKSELGITRACRGTAQYLWREARSTD
jgi:hypothetical protein